MKTYEYYINLDERGEFYSDVRDENGETVVEFDTEFAIDASEQAMDIRDTDEIAEYLQMMGVISDDDEVIKGN